MALGPTRSDNAMKDMAQVMQVVRAYPDSRLADVLAGKDMSVPQFAAMMEAMGRKQLRTAMDGQQAQQEANQPSVKDQLMAEEQQAAAMEGGIAALPAENMQGMGEGEGYAGGGIIAFAGGGETEEPRNPLAFLNPSDWFSSLGSSLKQRQVEAEERNKKINPYAATTPTIYSTPTQEELQKLRGEGQEESKDTKETKEVKTSLGGTRTTGGLGALGAAKGVEQPRIPTMAELRGEKTRDYLSGLKEYSDAMAEGNRAAKEQSKGEMLMAMGKGLLSKPTLAAGAAEGFGGIQDIANSMKKADADFQKTRAMYNLEMAKAQEASEKGDMQLALEHSKLAENAKFHMDSIAVEKQKVQAMLARATAAGSTTKSTTLSLKDAVKEYNDLDISDKKALQKDFGIKTARDYWAFNNTGQSVQPQVYTTPGKDAKIRD